MKKRLLYVLLCVEAVLFIVAALLISPTETGGIIAAQQAPFAQIGTLLRGLSLSGGLGNAFAFVIYILISCVPAVFLLVRLIKKRARAEDALLAVMSGYLFYLIYMMINPADIGNISMGSEAFGKAVLGGVFWSILVGWLVLRLLRYVKGKDTQSILKMLGILFALASAFIVFSAAYIGTAGLKAEIETVKAGNTITSNTFFSGSVPGLMNISGDITPTITFMIFRFVIGLIPVVTDVLILLTARTLAEQLKSERYSLDAVKKSEKLARLCKYAVVIIVLSSVALNLIQLIAAGGLRTMNFINNIPLGSIILALAVLLLSRYFAESRNIKRENEMFV